RYVSTCVPARGHPISEKRVDDGSPHVCDWQPKRRPAPILFRYLRKLDFETLLNALSSLCRPSLNEVLQPMLSYHRCQVIEKLLCSMIIGVLCKNSGPCPRAEF